MLIGFLGLNRMLPLLAPDEGGEGGGTATPTAPASDATPGGSTTTTPAAASAETKNTESAADTSAKDDNIPIPKSRFDQVNKRAQDAEAETARLRQLILDREEQDRLAAEAITQAAAEAETARLAAEKEAEEAEAERQREWQKLADKRERTILDKEARIAALQANEATITAQLTATTEQAQREVAEAAARVNRLSEMLSRNIDAETAEWPDEVKSLDPGKEAIEQRVQWVEQCRALAARLKATPPVPGTPRSPKPAPSTPAPTEEQRGQLLKSGQYNL